MMSMWTIYNSPDGYPGRFVVRKFLSLQGRPILSSRPPIVCASLDEARGAIPPGLTRYPRAPSDAPAVVETWL